MAYGVPALRADELECSRPGEFDSDGNACLMAAGTGLGQAVPGPPARSPRAVALGRWAFGFRARGPREIASPRVPDGAIRPSHLRARHLGQGIHQPPALHERQPLAVADRPAMRMISPAAIVSRRGLDGSDPQCVEALQLFVSIDGSAAANLGLDASLPAAFTSVEAFPPEAPAASTSPLLWTPSAPKPPMTRLVETDARLHRPQSPTGLLGAAVYAASLAG